MLTNIVIFFEVKKLMLLKKSKKFSTTVAFFSEVYSNDDFKLKFIKKVEKKLP